MRKCENYVTNQGVNCVLSSFADNVSLYNEKFDDSYIFFLMNGFDIRYVETCFDDVYEILFSHNLDRLIETFMRRYGITYGFYSHNHKTMYILSLASFLFQKYQALPTQRHTPDDCHQR